MVILQHIRRFWSEVTAPVLSVRSESGCVLSGPLRMTSVRAKEGQFGNCLLVAQRNASSMDTIEDGLPDESGCISILTGRCLSCDVDMDLDIGVGVDDRDCARWTGKELQLDAVAIKRLFGVEKKLPPVILDEVDHKAAEDSSTSRAVWKSNDKGSDRRRRDSMSLKLGLQERLQKSRHHVILLSLGTLNLYWWRDFSKHQ